jgi:hypothetical protein
MHMLGTPTADSSFPPKVKRDLHLHETEEGKHALRKQRVTLLL